MIKIVDLFSGAGGLTFGFYYKIVKNRFVKNDAFEFVFSNEFNDSACKTFQKNFPEIALFQEDIKNINKEYLLSNNIICEDIDLIIGGPPCQSFSTAGKREYDERAKLFTEYRRMLLLLKPKMFIFENVMGMLSLKDDLGNSVYSRIEREFAVISSKSGNIAYKLERFVIDASDYGIPQTRKRVFVIGIRSDIKGSFEMSGKEKKKVTVEDAIGDLPSLNSQDIEETKYKVKPVGKYQNLMRKNSKKISLHKNWKYGVKIQTIMNNVKQGEGKAFINKLVESGELPKSCYLTSGYNNTYGRLWWNRPSTTITNNLSTPSSLRCIHPLQNRPLTSREGARLQSFPDFFEFVGTKGEINSQIGNAVPPLLAIKLAQTVELFFEREDETYERKNKISF